MIPTSEGLDFALTPGGREPVTPTADGVVFADPESTGNDTFVEPEGGAVGKAETPASEGVDFELATRAGEPLARFGEANALAKAVDGVGPGESDGMGIRVIEADGRDPADELGGIVNGRSLTGVGAAEAGVGRNSPLGVVVISGTSFSMSMVSGSRIWALATRARSRETTTARSSDDIDPARAGGH